MLEILKGTPSGGGEGDGGDFPIKIMVMLHVVGNPGGNLIKIL